MSADTGLCALTHLDFYCRTRFKIILEYAETSRCDLYYSIGAVLIEVLVQTALARVVEYAKLRSRSCEALVSITADRAV